MIPYARSLLTCANVLCDTDSSRIKNQVKSKLHQRDKGLCTGNRKDTISRGPEEMVDTACLSRQQLNEVQATGWLHTFDKKVASKSPKLH